MISPLAGGRYLAPLAGSVLLTLALVAGSAAVASSGGSAAGSLVSQMLVNAIVVVGLQVYIGNTGILSFGHVGFGAIAGYVVAVLAIDPLYKQLYIPEAPFGLGEVHVPAGAATGVAVVVSVLVAFLVGLGLVRSGTRAGAVAPTMITLALLFLVREVARNFTDLTGGVRGGLAFGPGNSLEGRGWIYAGLAASILVARVFRETRTGRLAQAAREDEIAARTVGVNPAVPQMIALLVSVSIVAVGASLRVQLLGTMTPNLFFFSYTLLTLAMLIVGGRRSVTGAVVGVVVITAGNELTRYLAAGGLAVPGLGWLLREGLSDLFLGGAMLGFMILRPSGLLRDRELDDVLPIRRDERRVERTAPDREAHASRRLVADGLTVDFGGFRALRGASVEVEPDEIVGLIGPNGAGKTTALNAVTGLVALTEGRIALGPEDLAGRRPHEIARAGLARTFQSSRVFVELSVEENVAIAGIVAARHRAHRSAISVEELVEAAGLWEVRHRRAGELDHGSSRRLELARAAALRPEVLLLDEPVAGMSEAESFAMIERVRSTARSVGAGVLVIDHDLHFITTICDRIYVLDQGRVIALGAPEAIKTDPGVRRAYLGTMDAHPG